MTTSTQTIGDHTKVFNDLDLLALIALMSEIVARSPDKYVPFHHRIEHWEDVCSTYGPGTIDLGLEDIVANHLEKAEITNLLTAVENQLASFESVIPSTILSRCNAPGVKFNDYPCEKIRVVTDALRLLMARQNP